MRPENKDKFGIIGQEIAKMLTMFLNETMNDVKSLELYEDELDEEDGMKLVMYSITLKFLADLSASVVRTVELVNPDVDGDNIEKQVMETFKDSLRLARENVTMEDVLDYKAKLSWSENDDDDGGPKGMIH